MKCWIDSKKCFDSERMIAGVLNSGICKDCYRKIGHETEIENFLFEILGTEKDVFVDENSTLKGLVQRDVMESAFPAYEILEETKKLLKKQLDEFLLKVHKLDTVLGLKDLFETNRELILVSGGQDAWEDFLRIFDSRSNELKIYKELIERVEELYNGSNFENESTFSELIDLFREIDETQC
ncbi:MAG: hypothetical protein PHX25_01840 [Candidatus Pacebacteria bacterium]|nr:hypothetical protein [Candidatus Paceibacterota bacterium]